MASEKRVPIIEEIVGLKYANIESFSNRLKDSMLHIQQTTMHVFPSRYRQKEVGISPKSH